MTQLETSPADAAGAAGWQDPVHGITLGDLLRENARSYPQRTATVCGEHRASWPAFDERVNRLAAVLAGEGVGAGDRVLWLAQTCHRLLESVLACAKLGAVLCPANWRGSADELAFVIEDTAPTVTFWQEGEIAPAVDAARERTGAPGTWIRHDTDDADGYEARLGAAEPVDPQVAVDPFAPVLQFYTAAFTGRPNGALLSHLGWVLQDLAIANLQRLDADTVYLNSGPLFHVGSFMTTMATFHLGGTNVFTPRFDPEVFCRLVEAEGITTAFLVGPMLERVVEANADRRYDLSSLRTHGGPPAWQEMTTPEPEPSPWARGAGGYGQTEVTGLVTFKGIGGDATGSHGRPLPVAQVAVLDPDGNELPPGEVGELAVRGPTTMVAYHARPDETARRQRDGWHRTNDLGRREPDGSITFIGPATTMIKTGVENVYPAEVERVLAAHPDVAEVCVIGRPDPQWSQRVTAVVVPREGADPDTDALIAHCRDQLASYKKPRDVVFVETLPKDDIGFVDRAAVDEQHGGGNYPGPGRTRG